MPIDTTQPLQPEPDKRGVLILPHFFWRDLMPGLKDTEFRLLLVVFGETLGWVEEDRVTRRTRKWFSHSLLCAQTGRGGEAVSNAVDALVRKNFLVVLDADGKLLLTRRERRRSQSRLYYALSDSLMNRVLSADPGLRLAGSARFITKFEVGKPGTIKQKDKLNSVHKEAHASFSVSKPKTPRVSGWTKIGSLTASPTHLLGSGKEGI